MSGLTRVLEEMRTLVDMSAAPTLATVNRWVELLESAEQEDAVVVSAREQARRDA